MFDLTTRNTDFPLLEDVAYLASAEEGLPPLAVAEAINHYWEHKGMGLEGLHLMLKRLQQCQTLAASFLGMEAQEVMLASSTKCALQTMVQDCALDRRC
jgi:selenocysteine lyase/cysteine desulfurase